MLEELQRRNFAPTTISTYLHALEQFARHFKCQDQPPADKQWEPDIEGQSGPILVNLTVPSPRIVINGALRAICVRWRSDR